MAFTTPRVFNHPLMNAPEYFHGELALRQLPKTIDGDEWGRGIEGYVDDDVVGGLPVSGPGDDESDRARLHGVQPEVCWFFSVVHVIEIVHIPERDPEDPIASEIDRRSFPRPGFDRLGDNHTATWFLWETGASLHINNQGLKGHSVAFNREVNL